MIKITRAVSVEMGEGTFEHGQIEIERVNQWESKINVDVQLVVGRDDEEEFHKELQDLVEKYAI